MDNNIGGTRKKGGPTWRQRVALGVNILGTARDYQHKGQLSTGNVDGKSTS